MEFRFFCKKVGYNDFILLKVGRLGRGGLKESVGGRRGFISTNKK
jgi:hypothetical protein